MIITSNQVIAQDTPDAPEDGPEASLNTLEDADYITPESGSTANYKLILRNNGKQRENFYIDIEADNNWDEIIVDPQAGISLNPGASKQITITFQVPESLFHLSQHHIHIPNRII